MNYTNYYNKLLVDAVMDRDNYQKMGYKKIAFKKAPTFWKRRNFLKNGEKDKKGN